MSADTVYLCNLDILYKKKRKNVICMNEIGCNCPLNMPELIRASRNCSFLVFDIRPQEATRESGGNDARVILKLRCESHD